MKTQVIKEITSKKSFNEKINVIIKYFGNDLESEKIMTSKKFL
jgi:hypothetical protein